MQSANGTLSADDRQAIQNEMDGLRGELDRVSGSTEFNGQPLLSGEQIDIQAGTGGGGSDVISLSTPDISAAGLGLDSIDLSTAQGARDALDAIDSAITSISSGRGDIGAAMNRFDAASDNLAMSMESTAAGLSRIADANIGAETYGLSRDENQLKAGIAVQKKASALKGLLVNMIG
jgi:flagellin